MNYLGHFGFRELPFSLTPDPAFFFPGRSTRETLDALLTAAASGDGLITVVGEVGVGKTLLCRTFAAISDPRWAAIHVANPSFEPQSLLVAVAENLRVADAKTLSAQDQMKGIARALLGLARQQKRVVLCIDESQTMALETFETVRLLSNLETEKRKLLQIVLFGQPELDCKLASENLRNLVQRVTFRQQLGALDEAEIGAYVTHRMEAAGYSGRPALDDGVARYMHRLTAGSPRLVNVVMHKALLLAYAEGVWTLERRHVKAAAEDTPAISGAGEGRASVVSTAVAALKRRSGGGTPAPVRPQSADAGHEWFWRCVSALLVAAVAWVVWVAYQLQLPHIATDKAYLAAEDARRRNPATPPVATPVLAPTTDPAAPESLPGLRLRMAESIETPIHLQEEASEAPAPSTGR